MLQCKSLSRRRVVIQSVLCKDVCTCEENRRGLKNFVIRIKRTSVVAYKKVVSKIAYNCVRRISNKKFEQWHIRYCRQ